MYVALIKCAECGKEISSLATACPHCGCPREFQAEATDLNTQSTSTEVREIDPIWNEAMESVLSGRTLSGMNIIQQATGISHKEACTIVDYMEEHKKLPNDLPKTESERAIEKQLQKQPKPTTCKSCRKQISTHTEVCPHCGNQTGVHVCPKCNSINTEIISGASKASSVFLFGVFAANKVMSKYRCRDCNHKF